MFIRDDIHRVLCCRVRATSSYFRVGKEGGYYVIPDGIGGVLLFLVMVGLVFVG